MLLILNVFCYNGETFSFPFYLWRDSSVGRAGPSYGQGRRFNPYSRYQYGDVMVSTGINEHSRNKSQVCVKSKPKK